MSKIVYWFIVAILYVVFPFIMVWTALVHHKYELGKVFALPAVLLQAIYWCVVVSLILGVIVG